PRDTDRLGEIIRELSAAGNTVLMVEHDPSLIRSADQVIEMGPGAGERGGRVMFAGPKQEFLASSCLTARYLSGEESIPVPLRRRRQERKFLEVRRAAANNLKGIDVRIPLRVLTCITGVSGSGKSTLVQDTLYRALAREFTLSFEKPGAYEDILGIEHVKGVRLIDQEPIGKTPRSNPVTYVKAFDLVRRLFAGLPQAKRQRLGPGHFPSTWREDGARDAAAPVSRRLRCTFSKTCSSPVSTAEEADTNRRFSRSATRGEALPTCLG
ncbi:MAG TPA: excinuclease ABC subunit A, partial [Nitrospirota bacterium]